jgi:hypothetical protein
MPVEVGATVAARCRSTDRLDVAVTRSSAACSQLVVVSDGTATVLVALLGPASSYAEA